MVTSVCRPKGVFIKHPLIIKERMFVFPLTFPAQFTMLGVTYYSGWLNLSYRRQFILIHIKTVKNIAIPSIICYVDTPNG